MSNIKINLSENGVTTLDTAGKYCDKNIEVDTTDVWKNAIKDVWAAIQKDGERTNYSRFLAENNFTARSFKPVYDIVPTGTNCWYNFADYNSQEYYEKVMLEGQVNIKELEAEQGITLTFGLGGQNCTKMCISPLISAYNVVDVSEATSLAFAFYGGYLNNQDFKSLMPKRIERLICSETTPFDTTTFQYASGYEYIGFEGVIGKSINLQWSVNINKESITKLIGVLSDSASGQTVTLSVAAVNGAFTDEQWQNLINSKPNWVVNTV